MGNAQAIALGAASLFFAAGAALVVLLPKRRARKAKPKTEKVAEAGVFEETCRVCRKTLVLHPNTITLLSPSEKGMVVSARPELRGKVLGRFICPYCDGAHYFVKEKGVFHFAGANFYEPQGRGAVCMACQKPLKTPPWPEASYDGHIEDATMKSPDFGLICSRCHAVCCVACCEAATKGGAGEAGYCCPRCNRRPVDRFFHP